MADNKSPGFQRKPDYPLSVVPADARVRIVVVGEVVAESDAALVMREKEYDPAYYIPQADVRLDMLARTDHASHCPFKGDASYWSINAGGGTVENAAWSYETPFDEVAEIGSLMSFYASKVDAIEVDEN